MCNIAHELESAYHSSPDPDTPYSFGFSFNFAAYLVYIRHTKNDSNAKASCVQYFITINSAEWARKSSIIHSSLISRCHHSSKLQAHLVDVWSSFFCYDIPLHADRRFPFPVPAVYAQGAMTPALRSNVPHALPKFVQPKGNSIAWTPQWLVRC